MPILSLQILDNGFRVCSGRPPLEHDLKPASGGLIHSDRPWVLRAAQIVRFRSDQFFQPADEFFCAHRRDTARIEHGWSKSFLQGLEIKPRNMELGPRDNVVQDRYRSAE